MAVPTSTCRVLLSPCSALFQGCWCELSWTVAYSGNVPDLLNTVFQLRGCFYLFQEDVHILSCLIEKCHVDQSFVTESLIVDLRRKFRRIDKEILRGREFSLLWRENTSWCKDIHLRGKSPVGSNLAGFCPKKPLMEVLFPGAQTASWASGNDLGNFQT